jgi:monoamine oxidase
MLMSEQIDEASHTELARVRDVVEAECQKIDLASAPDEELDSMTFAAYLESRSATPIAIQTATVWTRAMLGQEPADISALFFLQYCKAGGGLLQMRSDRKGGGQHLRIRQGTQHFSKSLAATFPAGTVRLNEKVTAIRQTDSGSIRVQSSQGDFEAKKIICAVPPPILKDITFEPQLPDRTALAVSSYRYGFYMKVMIRFRTPFWVDKGLCGLSQSFAGPAAIFRDTSVPTDDKHVLTCFMAGKPGIEWSKLGAEERQELLLKQIGEIYGVGSQAQDQFVELLDYEWRTDAFTGYGCPSPALQPGALSAMGIAWKDPVGGVYFAGTEYSSCWRGYMEGAVRSGESTGAEVLQELKRMVSKS